MRTLFGLLFFLSTTLNANCIIYNHDRPLDSALNDPLYHLLSQTAQCPNSPSEFKSLIALHGLTEHVFMVANRGRNNPALGSFSFFESIAGRTNDGYPIKEDDFYIGYFTHAIDGIIHLDEQAIPNKLLIESIVWDNDKQMFNFYELKTTSNDEVRWFYRGDSRDAYLDNARLYRFNRNEENHFGKRMRCSACHNSGGPILKESAFPNNDWWNQIRKLPSFPNKADSTVELIMATLENPMVLSRSVERSMKRLFNRDSPLQYFRKTQTTLQEQLRPLFCTVEINLESANQYNNSPINIPSAFWLDKQLHFNVASSITRDEYRSLLKEFAMEFPETSLSDADRSWLTPVKGTDDDMAIDDLINNKMITRSFAEAVLMIDFVHPIFSKSRCNLLRLIPEKTTSDWQLIFRKNLKNLGTKEALLLAYYLDKDMSHEAFEKILEKYKEKMDQLITTETGRRKVFNRLIYKRKAVSKAEMSQNPLGEILEPGFRVIFPISKRS